MNGPRSFAELGAPDGESSTSGPTHSVRFTRRFQNYYPGDVAAFPIRIARRLVREGFGERVNIAEMAPGTDLPPGAELAIRGPGTPPTRGE